MMIANPDRIPEMDLSRDIKDIILDGLLRREESSCKVREYRVNASYYTGNIYIKDYDGAYSNGTLFVRGAKTVGIYDDTGRWWENAALSVTEKRNAADVREELLAKYGGVGIGITMKPMEVCDRMINLRMLAEIKKTKVPFNDK